MSYDTVPEWLRSRDQWLLYDRSASSPRQPHWEGDFWGISWSDPDDWHSFERAVVMAESQETWGIGYVTAVNNDEHPTGAISVIDIDSGVDEDGELKDWVPDIEPFLERGCYVEWSPSHDEPGDSGLHIPVVGYDIPNWFSDSHLTDKEHEGVDLLTNKFCTVTGDTVSRVGGESAQWAGGESAQRAGGEPAQWADDWVHEWLADAYENLTGERPRQATTLSDTAPEPASDDATPGGSGSKTTTQNGDADEYDEWLDEDGVRDALSHITPDVGYSTWRNIGFALVDHFTDIEDGEDDGRDVARELFVEWSKGDVGDWTPDKWDREAPDLLDDIITRAKADAGEDDATIASVIDLAKTSGWNPDDTGRSKPTSGPTGPDDADEDDTASEYEASSVALCPADVKAVAGIGEDETVADLADREKAACVWDLIKQTDDFHVRVRRDNGSLWAYDDGVWTPDGERALRHAARLALGSMNYGQNVLTELKAQARSDPTCEIDADTFGLDPGYVAVENGRLDLEAAAGDAGTDAVRPLQPDDYALARLPVAYDPDAECDEWKRFVGEVVETEKIEAVQEYVGYCLHRDAMPFNKALLLVGSGSNGKSTFLNVVRALLGEQHTTTKPVHKFDEDNHVADLYGALANIDADLSEGSLSSTGIATFKRLVGGDKVDARRLYEDAFSFKPTTKHLYACNQVPDVTAFVSDADIAFWRRWIVVQFPNYFPPGARDENLQDRLTKDTALSAVLNWAIDGWGRLLSQGAFTNIENHDETRRLWQSWGDSMNEFISEHTERDENADRVSTSDAFRRYVSWCREHGKDHNVTQRRFTDALKQEGTGFGKHRINGKVQHGYTALGFSDAVPEIDEDSTGGAGIDSDQSRLG